MNYKIIFTKQALKDLEKIKQTNLKNKTVHLLKVLQTNPYTPPYEKLIGDMEGIFSRRINIQHRLVYELQEEEKIVKIIRMWTHYGE